jgi:hypothetical protein
LKSTGAGAGAKVREILDGAIVRKDPASTSKGMGVLDGVGTHGTLANVGNQDVALGGVRDLAKERIVLGGRGVLVKRPAPVAVNRDTPSIGVFAG